jgi:hypothetical protein
LHEYAPPHFFDLFDFAVKIVFVFAVKIVFAFAVGCAAGDKVALEAGNLAFIMAKELEKTAGCTTRVLNPSNWP